MRKKRPAAPLIITGEHGGEIPGTLLRYGDWVRCTSNMHASGGRPGIITGYEPGTGLIHFAAGGKFHSWAQPRTLLWLSDRTALKEALSEAEKQHLRVLNERQLRKRNIAASTLDTGDTPDQKIDKLLDLILSLMDRKPTDLKEK